MSFIVAPKAFVKGEREKVRVVVAPTNLEQRLKSSRCGVTPSKLFSYSREKKIVNGILESNVILEPFLRLLRSSKVVSVALFVRLRT